MMLDTPMAPFIAPNRDPMSEAALFVTPREPFEFMQTARGLVFDYVRNKLPSDAAGNFTEEDVSVFWFSKDGDSWQAALVDTQRDDYFYRVVHNAVTSKTSFDVYVRFDSQILGGKEKR